MSLCSEEKKKLIEELGLHFESKASLPPLAARIFAIALLSKEEGYSFEQIMEITKASKSSVSTSLNLLIQLKYLEYFTKPGERKRYYRNAKNNLRISLEEQLASIQQEIKIVEKMNVFNREHNPNKFEKQASVGIIFLDYLENQKENLKHTIEKIIEFENNRIS